MKRKNYMLNTIFVCIFSISWLSLCQAAENNLKPAPDFELIDQENNTITLSDLTGKVKILTFIYTRCHMPKMCPLMTKNFREIQKSLGDDNSKAVFLTITFDPETDTPETLKKYGQLYMADFTNWHFLTGDKTTITNVCDAYGIINDPQEKNIMIRHSLITFIIDRENNIQKGYIGNEWNPLEVYEYITALINSTDSG
ncbi:MAG: SCO family protein [bacterium]|nr:SCO family protein [bacterium]